MTMHKRQWQETKRRTIDLVARVTIPETGKQHLIQTTFELDVPEVDQTPRKAAIRAWCIRWCKALR